MCVFGFGKFGNEIGWRIPHPGGYIRDLQFSIERRNDRDLKRCAMMVGHGGHFNRLPRLARINDAVYDADRISFVHIIDLRIPIGGIGKRNLDHRAFAFGKRYIPDRQHSVIRLFRLPRAGSKRKGKKQQSRQSQHPNYFCFHDRALLNAPQTDVSAAECCGYVVFARQILVYAGLAYAVACSAANATIVELVTRTISAAPPDLRTPTKFSKVSSPKAARS